jgi:hypothetical protein
MFRVMDGTGRGYNPVRMRSILRHDPRQMRDLKPDTRSQENFPRIGRDSRDDGQAYPTSLPTGLAVPSTLPTDSRRHPPVPRLCQSFHMTICFEYVQGVGWSWGIVAKVLLLLCGYWVEMLVLSNSFVTMIMA